MKILDENTKDRIEELKSEEFTTGNIEAIAIEFFPHYTFVENEKEASEHYKEGGYLNDEDEEYDESILIHETLNAESLTVFCLQEGVEYTKTAKLWVNEYYTDPGMAAESYVYELHVSVD